jgi:hypothetical protein
MKGAKVHEVGKSEVVVDLAALVKTTECTEATNEPHRGVQVETYPNHVVFPLKVRQLEDLAPVQGVFRCWEGDL